MNSKHMGNAWAIAAIGVLLATGTARADIMVVQGSTSGTFVNGAVNVGSSVGHLTFTGGSFGPINSDQTLILSALNGVDLNNATDDYDPFTFLLTVTFAIPLGTSGGPVAGDITGSVHGNSGHVTFDFSNSPTHFTFGSGGSFDLIMQDLTVDVDSNRGRGTLQGNLSNVVMGETTTQALAAVPEPASVILLMTMLGGVAVSLRRKLAR